MRFAEFLLIYGLCFQTIGAVREQIKDIITDRAAAADVEVPINTPAPISLTTPTTPEIPIPKKKRVSAFANLEGGDQVSLCAVAFVFYDNKAAFFQLHELDMQLEQVSELWAQKHPEAEDVTFPMINVTDHAHDHKRNPSSSSDLTRVLSGTRRFPSFGSSSNKAPPSPGKSSIDSDSLRRRVSSISSDKEKKKDKNGDHSPKLLNRISSLMHRDEDHGKDGDKRRLSFVGSGAPITHAATSDGSAPAPLLTPPELKKSHSSSFSFRNVLHKSHPTP